VPYLKGIGVKTPRLVVDAAAGIREISLRPYEARVYRLG
jgi:hypothetical protein